MHSKDAETSPPGMNQQTEMAAKDLTPESGIKTSQQSKDWSTRSKTASFFSPEAVLLCLEEK